MQEQALSRLDLSSFHVCTHNRAAVTTYRRYRAGRQSLDFMDQYPSEPTFEMVGAMMNNTCYKTPRPEEASIASLLEEKMAQTMWGRCVSCIFTPTTAIGVLLLLLGSFLVPLVAHDLGAGTDEPPAAVTGVSQATPTRNASECCFTFFGLGDICLRPIGFQALEYETCVQLCDAQLCGSIFTSRPTQSQDCRSN